MTIKELSRLRYLNDEIKKEKDRLIALEEASTNTAVKITGLPHLQGASNKTALAAEIADAKAAIEEKIILSVIEYNKINRYIASIDDCLIRQIISLRFVDGLAWCDVAQTIGGGNTEHGVQMTLKRYFKTH